MAPGKKRRAPVEPDRFPWLQALLDLFRKALRIGGGFIGLAGDVSDGGVMAMAAALGGREAREDNVRTETADGANDVAENALFAPEGESLRGGFTETEVNGSREELFATIELARGEELLCADDTEEFGLLGTDQVLPAFAAGGGKISGTQVLSARKVGDHRFPFVIGMCAQNEDAAEGIQAIEEFVEFGGALPGGRGCGGGCYEEGRQ